MEENFAPGAEVCRVTSSCQTMTCLRTRWLDPADVTHGVPAMLSDVRCPVSSTINQTIKWQNNGHEVMFGNRDRCSVGRATMEVIWHLSVFNNLICISKQGHLTTTIEPPFLRVWFFYIWLTKITLSLVRLYLGRKIEVL